MEPGQREQIREQIHEEARVHIHQLFAEIEEQSLAINTAFDQLDEQTRVINERLDEIESLKVVPYIDERHTSEEYETADSCVCVLCSEMVAVYRMRPCMHLLYCVMCCIRSQEAQILAKCAICRSVVDFAIFDKECPLRFQPPTAN